MALIIDGYNLLNAAGIVGRGSGPGGLQRSRRALLNFLAASLPEKDLARTTVVFDAGESAPRGLPRQTEYHGMTVRFASEHADADSLIEELIEQDSAPRQLTVVSSDHRLHRAARRRRAQAMDSDKFYAETIRQRADSKRNPNASGKPPMPSEKEVQQWLRKFDFDPADTALPSPDNPFPPGYAEDLLEEEE